MWETSGGIVDYMDQGRPVVLEGVDKGAEALVNPLVGVLGLPVSLRVVQLWRALALCLVAGRTRPRKPR